MKRLRRRILPRADINVTPFIDILLVLLVIFMTITPMTPKGLNAAIPQASPPSNLQREDTIILSVDRGGTIRINREEVSIASLMARLQAIFKSRNDRTVFIQADDQLLFNDVAQLIDTAKSAGIDRVGLMTERISAK